MQNKTKDKSKLLGETQIGKALFQLSLPATIGMLVMALYNIADTIFVGRGVGSMAIAGLATVFPIQMIIMAIAQTIGVGGSSIISRRLGEKRNEKAHQTFSNLITLIVIISLIMTPLSYSFMDEILFLFGARDEILTYSVDYFKIILWGGPFISFAMMANNTARAEGNANVAMYTMLISAILNLILDPILIFGFDMGIEGAGWATFFSQVAAAAYLMYFYTSGNSVLKAKAEYMNLDKQIVGETLAIGASSLARQVSSSVMIAVLNHSLVMYGGGLAVAVFGVIYRLLMVIFMPIIGIVQGFLPLAGFNYGAKDYQRVKNVLKIASKAATYIAIGGFVVVMLFADQLISIFSTDKELIEAGAVATRYIIMALPVIGFQIIGSGLFQAIGKALPSLFLSLTRQVVFLIPLVLILPVHFGLNGIWFSFPLADLLSAIITSIFVWNEIKLLNKKNIEK